MSISSVGSQSTSLLQLMKDKRNAMRSMMSAVEAGDMTRARSNASALQSDQSKIDAIVGASSATGTDSTASLRSTIKTDLSNLLAAVQSGDQSQATAALAQFKADRPMGPPPADQTGDADAAASSTKSLVGDLKSMLKAIASGDAIGATSYATALRTDLDTVLGTGTSPSTAVPATASSGGGATASFLDDLTALLNAVQSGDATGTSTAVATLAGDVTSTVGTTRRGGHRGHHAAPPEANTQSGDTSTPSILSLLDSAVASSKTDGTTTSSKV